MNKYMLKNSKGFYYVKGQGFASTCNKEATALDDAQLDTLADLGFEGQEELAFLSFAVNYIRQSNLDEDNQVCSDDRNPSKRRFATRDEAIQHGTRFGARKATADGEPGSAGHIGFYVTESTDPVNAAVNWKTGLTNSIYSL